MQAISQTYILAPVPFQLLGRGRVLPSGPNWLFERKFDGYRAQVVCRDGDVRVFTRGHQDWTHRVPHIVEAVAALGRNLTLDGEICAINENDETDLSWLSDPKANAATVVFYAFDLLHSDTQPLSDFPLFERKNMLAGALGNSVGSTLRLVSHVTSSGTALLAETQRLGHEGVVAKKVNAGYEAGIRSSTWLKFKNRQTNGYLVAGWQLTSDGLLSSLLLATIDEPHRYCGRVGTGFTASERRSLPSLLPGTRKCALATPPPRAVCNSAQWSDLTATADIEYLEISSAGSLREPSFKTLGLRKVRSGKSGTNGDLMGRRRGRQDAKG